MAGRSVSSSLATAVVVLALVVGGAVLFLQGGDSKHDSGRQRPTHATTARPSGIRYAALPPEARATVQRILSGGSFAYDRDGTVFGNREGLLPPRPSSYYHEYTVPTPGESDRGARRIVAGKGSEMYYTADHYRSFRPIIGIPGTRAQAGQ